MVIEWLQSLDDATVRKLALFAAGALVVSVWIVATTWRKVARYERRTALARQMLDRGMSADDISRVLVVCDSLPDGADEEEDDPSDSAPEVRMVKTLTDHYYEGADVQKVVAAARANHRLDDDAARIVESMTENWASIESIVAVLDQKPEQVTERAGTSQPVAT